jgi:hypothetical protein
MTTTFPSPPGAGVSYDSTAGEYFVAYSAARANYSVTKTASGYSVTDKVGTGGTDALSNVDRLKFSDVSVNLMVQAKAAAISPDNLNAITELYVAFFNRVPDADGLSYWIDQLNGGKSITQISESFYNAGVQFSSQTGFSSSMTDTDFINVFYKNALGRPDGADAGGLAYWTGKLADHTSTRFSLAQDILSSAHTFKHDATWGWVADLLDNKVSVGKTFAIGNGLTYNNSVDTITHGMDIAKAVTSSSTADAIQLIGISDASLAG